MAVLARSVPVGRRFNGGLISILSRSNGRRRFRVLSTVRASANHCITLLPICSRPRRTIRSSNRLIVLRIIARGSRSILGAVSSSSAFRSVTAMFRRQLTRCCRVGRISRPSTPLDWVARGLLLYSQATIFGPAAY